MAFETLTLLDLIRVPVDVSQVTQDSYRAWCPHWPNISAFSASIEGVKAKLQYELEARLSRGESPTLAMSP
jgi:hypothetical protein